jgi:hypothetical protein
MTEFGNIDKQKANMDINARIKAVLMLLFQMFNTSRNNTANMIQNFIPHLKRTDRDVSSLPFFSKAYVSHKTNKEHILLSKISMIFQDYWNLVRINRAGMPAAEVTKFLQELELLEQIAKNGFDKYGVSGKFPKFTLMSKKQIDLVEVEEAKKERAEADKQEEKEQTAIADKVEAKNLMDEALGSDDSTSQDSDSTDAADEDVPLESESTDSTAQDGGSNDTPDSDDDTKKESDDSSSEAEKSSIDQVSTEDADACNGDCDNCDNAACQTNQTDADADPDELAEADEANNSQQRYLDEAEREDNLAGGIAGEAIDDEAIAAVEEAASTLPPMPEEETTADGTQDDVADDEPDHTDEEIEDSGHQ